MGVPPLDLTYMNFLMNFLDEFDDDLCQDAVELLIED